MTRKTITITEDAYELLRMLKRDSESFSDLVVRLTEGEDLIAFAGTCPGLATHFDSASDDLEESLETTRDDPNG